MQVARRAKVGELAAAVAVAQDVLPLDVPVDDALEERDDYNQILILGMTWEDGLMCCTMDFDGPVDSEGGGRPGGTFTWR
jgi:hypothetical protein